MTDIAFPNGTYSLNHDSNFNFPWNRMTQWSSGQLEALQLSGFGNRIVYQHTMKSKAETARLHDESRMRKGGV